MNDHEPKYTFGDGERASRRLALLARAYDPITRGLLGTLPGGRCRVAVDLGCGPGHTTRLLQEVVRPERTLGLDRSRDFIRQARRSGALGVEFIEHDVTREPWPAPRADVMLCRFLLTHLSDPEQALSVWARSSHRGGKLLVHETESLEAEHPALRRYYELVGALQAHYGQRLHVGERLDDSILAAGWEIEWSTVVQIQQPARVMAELHAMNLMTWRRDAFAVEAFDTTELDELAENLGRIADGSERTDPVNNGARQVMARRLG